MSQQRKEDNRAFSISKQGDGLQPSGVECLLPVPLYRFQAEPSDGAGVASGWEPLPPPLGFAGRRWE